MNKMRFCLAWSFIAAVLGLAQILWTSHVVDLKASDGTLLKASFFPAAKPVQPLCCSIKATVPVIRGKRVRFAVGSCRMPISLFSKNNVSEHSYYPTVGLNSHDRYGSSFGLAFTWR